MSVFSKYSFASGGQGPHGMGDLYAAQTVCVGFHTFSGEGAASWEAAMKITALRDTDSIVGV
jgi:hypothetical protein